MRLRVSILSTRRARRAARNAGEPPRRHRTDEAAFRDLYKQLVEINTTRSVGSCTRAAEAMRARLARCRNPRSRYAGIWPRRSARTMER